MPVPPPRSHDFNPPPLGAVGVVFGLLLLLALAVSTLGRPRSPLPPPPPLPPEPHRFHFEATELTAALGEDRSGCQHQYEQHRHRLVSRGRNAREDLIHQLQARAQNASHPRTSAAATSLQVLGWRETVASACGLSDNAPANHSLTHRIGSSV